MKVIRMMLVTVLSVSSLNSFAIDFRECVGNPNQVPAYYVNCVNSNFAQLAKLYEIPVYPCSNDNSGELGFMFQGCINNNFSMTGMYFDGLGLNLDFCMDNQDETFLGFYNCVNSNFSKISDVLN